MRCYLYAVCETGNKADTVYGLDKGETKVGDKSLFQYAMEKNCNSVITTHGATGAYLRGTGMLEARG